MKNSENTELKMFRQVSNFLDLHPELVKNYKAIKAHDKQLKDSIKKLDDFYEKKGQDSITYHKMKQEKKIDLSNALFSLSFNVCSYAKDNNNHALFNKFYSPISTIIKMSDTYLISHSRTCLEQLTNHQKALEFYNISQQQITILKTKINFYASLLLEPEKLRRKREDETEKITRELKKVSEHLKNNLDLEIMPYLEKDLRLHHAYKKARSVSHTEEITPSNIQFNARMQKSIQMQDH